MNEQTFSRREMLRLAAAGAFVGPAVSWLDIAAEAAQAHTTTTGRKHKSCIVLFMSGGPSHAHTFDVKPTSPYKTIPTAADGIEVCEYLPKVAKQMKHISLVRGMTTTDANHETAHFLMRTGFRRGAGGVDYPHFGAVCAKEIVREDTHMPNFVVLKPGSGSRNGQSAGFLGAQYAPMTMQDVGRGIASLAPINGDFTGLDRRAALLARQDARFAADYQLEAVKAKMESYRKAIELVHYEKAKEAFELDREPDHIKNLYGNTAFGRQCLGARRLVEAGVPFVEVMHPRYWDTHGGALTGQRSLAEELDQPMAALIADLAQRGMLEDTLVVWMGEFGRDFTGNNHWAKAWTTGFAGAGIAGGRVVGRTDAKAMTVEERPVHVADFVATIYKALGVRYDKAVKVEGRPIKLTDDGEPVHELFA